MNILDHFGDNQPRSKRVLEPEVVSAPPAVTSTAITRFQDGTGSALKADALAVLSITVKPVETQDAANKLADQRAQVKGLLKNIEARRKQIVEPLKREATDVDAEAKRWTDPLRKWDDDAERVLLAFGRKHEDDRRRDAEARQKTLQQAAEDQAKAEAAGDAEAAEKASTAIMQVEATAESAPITGYKTDAGTTFKRTTWRVEVVDASLVPDAYLIPDLKKLQAAVDGGARRIDGCNVFEHESLVVRHSR